MGFILAFGAFVVIGLPLTALFVLLTFLLTRRRKQARLALLVSLALLPVSCLYLFGAVWAGSGWLSLRGLDEGMFETYQVPLGYGYSADSEYLEDSGRLTGPGLSGEEWMVPRVGCAGPRVVLEIVPYHGQANDPPQYALLGGEPTFKRFSTEAALTSAVGQSLLWSEDHQPPNLCAPHRLWIDWLVLGVVLGQPLVWVIGTLFLIWAVWRSARISKGTTEDQVLEPPAPWVVGVLALTLGTFGIHQFYQGADRTATTRVTVSLLGTFLGLVIVPLFAVWALGLIGVTEGMLAFRGRVGANMLAQPGAKRK